MHGLVIACTGDFCLRICPRALSSSRETPVETNWNRCVDIFCQEETPEALQYLANSKWPDIGAGYHLFQNSSEINL